MKRSVHSGLAGLVVLLVLVGCRYLPPLDEWGAGGAQDVAVDTSLLVGAGPVNHWFEMGTGWVEELADGGCGIAHIAFYGWASGAGDMDHTRYAKQYRELVAACRRRGLVLFVEVVNDNQGLGKYGDRLGHVEKYLAQVYAACDFIREVTDCEYWLQPSGETGMGKGGDRVEAYCAKIFPKERLVYNGAKGSPSDNASWSSMFAWHPSKVSARPPKGAIVVSDHSGILREIYGAEWQTGGDGANVVLVEHWVQEMLDYDATAVVLYDFGGRKADREAYTALGRAAGIEFERRGSSLSGGQGGTAASILPGALDEINLKGVVWDHTDVSDWEITHRLEVTIFSKDRIAWRYDKVPDWKAVDGLHGNPWIVAEIGGQWRAATWEWLKPGQSDKKLEGDKTFGNHIKKSAWGNSWDPAVGEVVYFFVSGLARDSRRNARERTAAVRVVVQ